MEGMEGGRKLELKEWVKGGIREVGRNGGRGVKE